MGGRGQEVSAPRAVTQRCWEQAWPGTGTAAPCACAVQGMRSRHEAVTHASRHEAGTHDRLVCAQVQATDWQVGSQTASCTLTPLTFTRPDWLVLRASGELTFCWLHEGALSLPPIRQHTASVCFSLRPVGEGGRGAEGWAGWAESSRAATARTCCKCVKQGICWAAQVGDKLALQLFSKGANWALWYRWVEWAAAAAA